LTNLLPNISKYFVLVSIACSFATLSYSQNLYDLERSEQFATFLFQSSQYDLAAREYERIAILNDNKTVSKNLFVSYRLSNQYKMGLNRIEYFFPDYNGLTKEMYLETGKLLLLSNSFNQYTSVTSKQTHLIPAERRLFGNIRAIYDPSYRIDLSDLHNSDFNETSLAYIYEALTAFEKESFKSPPLAGALSAVVPGLGRIYAGDWKNAIFSLLFVGINSYQSYRGFSRNGWSSAQGWIFGGIGLGFYAGNIYGSATAAKRKNQQIRDGYKKKMDLYYFSM